MTQADQRAALERLQEIEKVISSNHQIRFPWQILITYGVLIGLVPAIERVTQHLTFGHQNRLSSTLPLALIHVVFYGILFTVAKNLVIRWTGAWKDQSAHPLILAAVQTQRPIAAAMVASAIGFSYLEQTRFIWPITTLLMGILFHAFAAFSRGPLRLLSWYSMALGSASFFIPSQYPEAFLFSGLTWLLSGGMITTAIVLCIDSNRSKKAKSF